MDNDARRQLEQLLTPFGQQHVLRGWNELPGVQRARLHDQIRAIDFARIESIRSQQSNLSGGNESLADRASRAVSPSSIVRLPRSPDERARWEAARRTGEELLRSGQVGAILVAGGQGTRLGFNKPKGILRIGPVSGASLFQVLAEQMLARSRRAGKPIPYFIMTSDATHEETVAFFSEHRHFGLSPQDVYFFKQGNMPAVDATTGQLLFADKGTLNTSPDGHGGLLEALLKAGLFDEMARRGIELLHYHQVDNPTAIVCDPVFLGFHSELKSDMSTKVVAKRSAEERMGAVVEIDGRTELIEYSDLPPDVARQTDANGDLLLWAGNTAIHVFDREFIRQIAKSDASLPFHVARKKVPYCDERGEQVVPQIENALKFERFIFDVLPFAQRALVLETDRAREFNPVKNATGHDSPQTAQAALLRLHAAWLRAAGVPIEESNPVEISPLFALDGDEVQAKCKPGTRFAGPTYLR